MRSILTAITILAASAAPAISNAADSCTALPSHSALQAALKSARAENNGGLNLDMWGTIIGRDGKVCAVAYTGNSVDAQWPGSRVISAQKANTANLYSATQPGGSLFGLQESNPVDVSVAYAGPASAFGSKADPMIGKAVGGVNVFGGGLALYNASGEIIGGLGVSGDTSCADHNIAWRARNGLKLDHVPAGVAKDKTDAIIYDIAAGKSKGGFGHPECGGTEKDVAAKLPAAAKAGK